MYLTSCSILLSNRDRSARGGQFATGLARLRNLLLIALVSVLAGCGFQLQGSADSVAVLTTLDVSATQTYGELVTNVERTLTQQGIAMNPEGGADYRLHLLGERATRRSVSTTNQVSVAEYVLLLAVDFELFDRAGDRLLPLTTISVERVYSFDRGSFVGSSEEEALLSREMQADIIQQILRRLEASLKDTLATPTDRVSPAQ
ncbi:MAG: LPS assembly lipoprotein LptE [SAR86 cluster bacterium]